MQEEHPDPPLSRESRKQISHMKDALSVQEVERYLYHQRENSE